MSDDVVLVAGAGGFIGGHLVSHLVTQGVRVRAADIKPLDAWWQHSENVEELVVDLADAGACRTAADGVSTVYNLAADMGGMGFIASNKALCMLSVLTSTHLLLAARDAGVGRFFYASSACVYALDKQTDPDVTALRESDAYPAQPEDGYGWEKLFTERKARHFRDDFGLETRVARYHNVYGPNGTYDGGREKAPAAICRKVALAKLTGENTIDIWGDGEQTRSFMYVDDCVKRLPDNPQRRPRRGARSTWAALTSWSVDQPARQISSPTIAGISLDPKILPTLTAPQGVRGRNSDNTEMLATYGWEPSVTLREGLAHTYEWIMKEVAG